MCFFCLAMLQKRPASLGSLHYVDNPYGRQRPERERGRLEGKEMKWAILSDRGCQEEGEIGEERGVSKWTTSTHINNLIEISAFTWKHPI